MVSAPASWVDALLARGSWEFWEHEDIEETDECQDKIWLTQ